MWCLEWISVQLKTCRCISFQNIYLFQASERCYDLLVHTTLFYFSTKVGIALAKASIKNQIAAKSSSDPSQISLNYMLISYALNDRSIIQKVRVKEQLLICFTINLVLKQFHL